MDLLLIFTQLTLGMMGVLGVATSSPGDWTKQLIGLVLGLLIVALVSRISPKFIVKISPFAYAAILFLLVLVLFVGVSPPGSQSKRWLDLGFFTLQPSELMKVAVIAYLTAFFHNHLGNWEIWRPMAVIGLAAGLILVEPNISTALFVFALAFAIMVAAGTTILRLTSISISAALIATIFAGPYLKDFTYIGERITAFFDMFGKRELTSTLSFQADRAQRTLQEAGFFGIGPGRPVMVPEAHTDMIAVSIGYALGLTGIVTLIALYGILAGRGIRIASSLQGPGSLLAAGATLYLCAQAALNLLVASGLLPVTGVVLPFVSYGLNSLISASIAMGFLHSAYRQARTEGVLT